ncbi:GSCFA domain-containing protein [Postechiella marina]|uniref:GSCFA domain-containing protein n=1 Tax=Postechiella marina TaxID=943941 RepID=A0ABP8CA72_9FLAO
MNLQTKIPLKKASGPVIDYSANVFLLGSCFSENIGGKLDYFKFKNTQNPFGILFHPKAIETLIFRAVNSKLYLDEDVFFNNEQWHCFDAHSKLSNASKSSLLTGLNKQISLTNTQIRQASHIIITFGTAWVYRFNSSKNVVANCHKITQSHFKKELLSVDTITQSLHNIVNLISTVNPHASVIFTVSPVRHIKDGFIENTRSKSHLIAAIHQLLNKEFKTINKSSSYFPSYEIMMDELRDYRFYNEDMIHPNATAIKYIWERFISVWVSQDALKTMEEVDAIQKGLLHKPFNSKSEAHQKFLKKLEDKKAQLQIKHAHLTF